MSGPASCPVPAEFICPITQDIMRSPLMCRTGLNFERSAILTWLQDHGNTNPLTRDPLSPSGLVPNRALEARISSWRKANNVNCEEGHIGQATGVNELFTCPASKLERTSTKSSPSSSQASTRSSSTPSSRPTLNADQTRIGLNIFFRRL